MREVLEVSSSGYFNWKRGQDDPGRGHGPSRLRSDEALLAHIRAIHAEIKGKYGWPQMHKELRARGIRIGKELVRVLQDAGEPVDLWALWRHTKGQLGQRTNRLG